MLTNESQTCRQMDSQTAILTRGTLSACWCLKKIYDLSKAYESFCTSTVTLCDDHKGSPPSENFEHTRQIDFQPDVLPLIHCLWPIQLS